MTCSPFRLVSLLLFAAAIASAQETATPAAKASVAPSATGSTTAPAAAPATSGRSSEELRRAFSSLLREKPSELATILSLDPTLLSNDAFLSGYPELARFVSEHPEVRRNPRYYLGQFRLPDDRRGTVREIFDGLAACGAALLIAFTFAWLVRTIIEQKRWTRLSRTQSEVHNKILDRFGTTEELLAYVRSPAGTKFLESAPIPLRAEQSTPKVGVTRILWSIQLGVVVVAASIGMLIVSGRFDAATSQGISAIGVIGFCVGLGFVASAVVSIVVSRRLGVWQGGSSLPVAPFDERA